MMSVTTRQAQGAKILIGEYIEYMISVCKKIEQAEELIERSVPDEDDTVNLLVTNKELLMLRCAMLLANVEVRR